MFIIVDRAKMTAEIFDCDRNRYYDDSQKKRTTTNDHDQGMQNFFDRIAKNVIPCVMREENYCVDRKIWKIFFNERFPIQPKNV